MKRFFSALILCLLLLVASLFIFLPYTKAENDPIIQLLKLPAPPPPNPSFKSRNPYKFLQKADNKGNPPKDDVPIEELMVYWMGQNSSANDRSYTPKPSEKMVQRMMAEIEKNPEIIGNYLNILPDTPEMVEKIKGFYDAKLNSDADDDGGRYGSGNSLKTWLTDHSKYFSDDLLKAARQVREDDDYVTNQGELLTLAHVDWEKARPIVDRLYNDSAQPVAQTLARWALYKHAIATKDSGETERYRAELKKAVEDKSAGGGKRDLAMDALVQEGDWDGRDDWYYSLLDDETLDNLTAKGESMTGLTTIINLSPPDKYKAKMLELVRSSNAAVRNAAIRNLAKMIDEKNPDVVAALLPWLENPKWAVDLDENRKSLINVLDTLQMPESVPGLIAVLNGIQDRPANLTSNSNRPPGVKFNYFELESFSRTSVIEALGTQKDSRAIAPLRHLLPELAEYERAAAIRALLACGGFSADDQVDALQSVAKNIDKFQADRKQAEAIIVEQAKKAASEDDDDFNDDVNSGSANKVAGNRGVSNSAATIANAVQNYAERRNLPMTADELQKILGEILVRNTEPEETLVTATIDRIERLDKKDPVTANALRLILHNWKGSAINTLLLKDLKNGKADTETIVKLLSLRKTLREKQSNDVYDIRSGTPTALGISACLIENDQEYAAVLESDNAATKTAMLACGRMIRARLPVQQVAENLKSADKLLAAAAEKYLESEDSAEARAIVLSLHPNEAKILGATVYFSDEDTLSGDDRLLSELYGSIGDDESVSPFYYSRSFNYYGNLSFVSRIGKTEKQLKKELFENRELLGVYAFGNNYVRIFSDRVIFSWEEDDSRYQERLLEPGEFDQLKNYLASQNVSELPPFISASTNYPDRELLMLGRQGGRRIYLKTVELPDFFAGLDKIFTEMRKPPARLRYKLEKDLAGLEILYAGDNLKAQTVWKNGADLRILIDNEEQRRRIDKELRRQEQIEEEAEEAEEEDSEEETEEIYAKEAKAASIRTKRREQRKYESYSWQQLSKNQLAGAVSQPSQIEYIPQRDNLQMPITQEQWKQRAANLEIRRGDDEEAIYKIMRGKPVKIGEGSYSDLLITNDGRWLIGRKDDDQNTLVRINLLTNREFSVSLPDDYKSPEPVSFIPALNKFVVFLGIPRYYGKDRAGDYYLLDAASGALSPVKGEFRPLLQQSFRSLQPAANPGEVWAAIPDTAKNRTVVGLYNTRTFTLKPMLKIPKIIFDSMAMWADETEKKVYFVYEGQLLSLPLPR